MPYLPLARLPRDAFNLNGDGLISPEEYAAAQTQHLQEMQPPMPPQRWGHDLWFNTVCRRTAW